MNAMPRPDGPKPRAETETMAGLCPTCQHVRVIVSERGSTFLRCRLATAQNAFAKYPPQPVRHCPGHEA